MKEIINVIVIGAVHHNTLGVIRSLGDNRLIKFNIDLLLVGKKENKRNFVSASKYVKRANVFCVDDDSEVIDFLLHLSKDGKKRVIICCTDGSAEQVMSKTDFLRDGFFCPESKVSIADLMSKNFQFQVAKQVGFSIPETQIIERKELGGWDVYPCIVKPEKSAQGGGKGDISISQNRNELVRAVDDAVSEQLFVQEYILKDMEYQLIGCSLNYGEIIIIPGFTRIIRQPFNTNTGYLEYAPMGDLEHYDFAPINDFLKTIGYSGLFSIEFLRGKNGVDYFLEINLRNDGNAYCVKTAGVNLPLIWCYYQVHGSIPNVNLSVDKTIRFMPEFSDFKHSVKEIGFFRWLVDFFSAKSHSIINKKDLKPFFSRILSIFGRKR